MCTPGPPGGPPRGGGSPGGPICLPPGGWYTPDGSLSPVSASELFPIHMPVRTGTSRPVVTARMPPAVGAPRPPNLSPPTPVLSARLLTFRQAPRRSEFVRRRGSDHVNPPVSHRWFPPLSSVGHWHRSLRGVESVRHDGLLLRPMAFQTGFPGRHPETLRGSSPATGPQDPPSATGLGGSWGPSGP